MGILDTTTHPCYIYVQSTSQVVSPKNKVDVMGFGQCQWSNWKRGEVVICAAEGAAKTCLLGCAAFGTL